LPLAAASTVLVAFGLTAKDAALPVRRTAALVLAVSVTIASSLMRPWQSGHSSPAVKIT